MPVNKLDITDYPLEMDANSSEWDSRAAEVEAGVNDGLHDQEIRSHLRSYTCGEDITEGDSLYQKPSDGDVYKTKADDVATMFPFVGFARETKTNGQTIRVAYDYISGLSGLTRGDTYYMDASTAGAITNIAPSIAKNVGVAISTTELLINREVSQTMILDAVATEELAYVANSVLQAAINTTFTKVAGDKIVRLEVCGNSGFPDVSSQIDYMQVTVGSIVRDYSNPNWGNQLPWKTDGFNVWLDISGLSNGVTTIKIEFVLSGGGWNTTGQGLTARFLRNKAY